MIKALIVDDDLNYAKYLLNIITTKFNNMHVSHIATDGQEALDILSSNRFDLVFLDLKMPKLDGIEVINSVNRLNHFISPKFIIISGDFSSIKILKKNSNITNIINKAETDENICRKIEPTVNEINYLLQLPKVKEYIITQLLEFGYDFKLRGTSYIMEAILYIYSNNNLNLLDNLEQNVLKYIAYTNQKSLLNIKTSISKATSATQKSLSMKMTSKSIITLITIQIIHKFN